MVEPTDVPESTPKHLAICTDCNNPMDNCRCEDWIAEDDQPTPAASPVAPPESDEERDSDECARCNTTMGIPYGLERTEVCNPCAQEERLELKQKLAELASPVAGGSAEKCENCGHTRREHTLAGRRLIDNCMCCANPSFKLAQPSAEGWVKVTPETMPAYDDQSETVYVSDGSYVGVAIMEDYHTNAAYFRTSGMTHFKLIPLPVPPAEERSSL